MKIDELKRIAKENDYEYFKSTIDYKFVKKDSNNYITINSKYENRIWTAIQGKCDDKDFNMIKAAIEFAETPLEDREQEKKFYLKHRWLKNGEDYSYLNFEISGLYYSLNNKHEASWAKTKFTLEEIEEIKEKFDTDLKDFELMEVEE